MYRQGDRVVHPNHGAGVVREIISQDGHNGSGHYYVIELYANRLTVMVPVGNADTIGVRLAEEGLVSAALAVLNEQPHHLPSDFKARQKELTEKLRSGDTRLIAEVCRDLTWRSKCGQLTSTDARLLEQARNFVATELAAVRSYEAVAAFETLSSLVAEGLALWGEPGTPALAPR